MDESDRAAIIALSDRVIESWNRHDMAAFSTAFAQDADFVNVVGMRQKGRQEILQAHVHLHATLFRNSVLTKRDLAVRSLAPTVALAHLWWTMAGGETVPGWKVGEERKGVMSWVLVKQGADWRVASSHNTDTLDLALPKAS